MDLEFTLGGEEFHPIYIVAFVLLLAYAVLLIYMIILTGTITKYQADPCKIDDESAGAPPDLNHDDGRETGKFENVTLKEPTPPDYCENAKATAAR